MLLLMILLCWAMTLPGVFVNRLDERGNPNAANYRAETTAGHWSL
jgi:hypothetical protein